MIVEQHLNEDSQEEQSRRDSKSRRYSAVKLPSLVTGLFRFRSREDDESEKALDLVYQDKAVDLRKIPFAREMFLKKKETVLGKRFRKTLLGYTKGAVNQFRGPYSTHVREYSDHYTIHRDFLDPRKNPLRHLAKDAPMELAAWAVGGLIALIIILLLIF